MRKKVFIVFLTMLAAGAILNSSCEKATIETEVTGTMSFSQDIVPIFKENCNQCHNGSRKPVLSSNPYGALKAGNYFNTEKPEESTLYIKLATGSSHLDKANETQKQKILLWIKQGALEN